MVPRGYALQYASSATTLLCAGRINSAGKRRSTHATECALAQAHPDYGGLGRRAKKDGYLHAHSRLHDIDQSGDSDSFSLDTTGLADDNVT
jgi:hypothetical protein